MNFLEIYGIEQDWDCKKALEKCKKSRGPHEYIGELLNAHAHLSKNEWPKFCAELNMTTKHAKNLIIEACPIMAWGLRKPKSKSKPKRNKPSPKLQFAIDWLRKYLSESERAVPATNCFYDAKQAGISERTLMRAKKYADVMCVQKYNCWHWYLAL